MLLYGYYFAHGLGNTFQSQVMAYALFDIVARDFGNSSAAKFTASYEPQMSRTDLEQARKIARLGAQLEPRLTTCETSADRAVKQKDLQPTAENRQWVLSRIHDCMAKD